VKDGCHYSVRLINVLRFAKFDGDLANEFMGLVSILFVFHIAGVVCDECNLLVCTSEQTTSRIVVSFTRISLFNESLVCSMNFIFLPPAIQTDHLPVDHSHNPAAIRFEAKTFFKASSAFMAINQRNIPGGFYSLFRGRQR
jgi:hypothetical protein